jgi:nitroreductase
MEYFDLITQRYSVRAYQPKPVEDWKLQKVLEAARMAPTAANRQPFQLIVIHTTGRQAELGQIYHKDWFTQAPLIICACGVPAQRWVRSEDKRRYLDVDVAIVMDHLILAAADLGLGTCWIAAFNARAARQVLRLPDEIEPLVFTPLGYPADSLGPKERKPLDQLVRYEHW